MAQIAQTVTVSCVIFYVLSDLQEKLISLFKLVFLPLHVLAKTCTEFLNASRINDTKV